MAMNEKWVLTSKRADFKAIGKRFGIDQVTARLIRNRDLVTEEEIDRYLNADMEDMYDPHSMKDMDLATEIMERKIQAGAKIRIISDYDADGVTSNYILLKGLRRCGAHVDYRIPDRVEDGYGLNESLVRDAAKDGVDTLITCDNGISAADQIALGNELGITTIITDHHEVPFRMTGAGEKDQILPPAAAVVDPKRYDCSYPFPSICGALVAFKFIQVLYERMGIGQEAAEEFIEPAAIGTVCDVMPLQDENRILVKEGLRRMQHTQIPGLRALIQCTGLQGKEIGTYHLGFVIGPCINASGRLSTAEKALDLLLCEDYSECLKMAEELAHLNEQRKELTRQGILAAKQYVEEQGFAEDDVLVVYLPDCHESIAGIIAGKVREEYNKPTFVITRSKQGLKGSGRSIPAYSMYEELTKCSDLLDGFGGHPLAAGLSLQEENLEDFRHRINELSPLTEEDLTRKIVLDLQLPFYYISEKLIGEMKCLEPCGTGNRKPVFGERGLQISRAYETGGARKFMKLNLRNERGITLEAICFQDPDTFWGKLEASCGHSAMELVRKNKPNQVRMTIAYTPEINEWNGVRSIQVRILNYQFRNL